MENNFKIQPMEPILTKTIIHHEDWIHEIKWDGIRGITYIQNKEVRIFTKRGFERTDFYPELQTVASLYNGDEAILDGEIIVLNKEGRPAFSDILVRERVRTLSKLNYYIKNYQVKYIIFDILSYNGNDIRKAPLKTRKEILNKYINKSSMITCTDSFNDGTDLYQLMKEKQYEGIVSKNINSPYYSGKNHESWYKVKIQKKMLVVVGGIQLKNGYPNSLMIGIYRNKKLEYIGNVSTGLKTKDFHLLINIGQTLGNKKSPFNNLSISNDDIIWLKPQITCYIHFMEWTNSGGLRHPRILGFSNEKPSMADGREYTDDWNS